MNVLFVCTGNTCRSPMAEAIMRDRSERLGMPIKTRSRGVAAVSGSPASSHSVALMKEKEIKFDHQSRQISEADVVWADFVFTMTTSHKVYLAQNFPGAADRIFTLKEYTGDSERKKDHDISDPFGGSIDDYRMSMAEIATAVDRFLASLNDESTLSG